MKHIATASSARKCLAAKTWVGKPELGAVNEGVGLDAPLTQPTAGSGKIKVVTFTRAAPVDLACQTRNEGHEVEEPTTCRVGGTLDPNPQR